MDIPRLALAELLPSQAGAHGAPRACGAGKTDEILKLLGPDKLIKSQSPSSGIFSVCQELVFGCLPCLDLSEEVSQGRFQQVLAPVQLVAFVRTVALVVSGACL